MGSGYGMKCPECGHEFDQYYGIGMYMTIVEGSTGRAEDSFDCPKCGHLFDPTKENFRDDVLTIFDWD